MESTAICSRTHASGDSYGVSLYIAALPLPATLLDEGSGGVRIYLLRGCRSLPSRSTRWSGRSLRIFSLGFGGVGRSGFVEHDGEDFAVGFAHGVEANAGEVVDGYVDIVVYNAFERCYGCVGHGHHGGIDGG